MKVEVDEVYCCDEEMKSSRVFDFNTKKESVLFVCTHCKKSFELVAKTIINAGTKAKRDPIMSP